MAPSAVETDLTVGKVKKKSRWDVGPEKRNRSSVGTSTMEMDTIKIECSQCGTDSNNDNQSNDNEERDERPTGENEQMFMCELCKKEFVKKSSLRQHIVTCHLPKSKPNVSAVRAYLCDVEGCTFGTNHPNNLKRHCRKLHTGKITPKPVKVMNKCSQCDKKFADIRNLRYHMRKIHKTGDLVLEIKRQCPLCPFTSTEHEKNKIHAHFENDHGIPMVWESRQFPTMGDFINWKLNTEKLTTTSYVRSYCTPSLLSFQCHRSGSYRKKGFDKRRMKEAGTCKINAFCPSAITVKVFENNVVCASYLATHIGHTNELEHIRMTPEERSANRAQRVPRMKMSKPMISSSKVKNKKVNPEITATTKPEIGNTVTPEISNTVTPEIANTVTPETATTAKRTNAEIEMEKLMLEVQQDMEECPEPNPDPPEHAIFLEHIANVHPSSVECLNLPHGTVENCQITVLTALEPTVINCIDLQAEKNKFLESFIRCINESVQSLDDLEYVRQHCQAILPTLRESFPMTAVHPGCETQVSVITQM